METLDEDDVDLALNLH